MNLRKYKFSLLFAAFAVSLSSGSAFAECFDSGCNAKVSTMYMSASGSYLLIGTDGNEGLITNCNPVSGTTISLPTSEPNFKSVYALLMMAQANESDVIIRTRDTAGSSCVVSYVNLTS